MPNPDEVATLKVAGHYFTDFESVWVQIRWTEPYPLFRFTTADIVETPGEPPPANWQMLQFKPGDECAIYLGKWLALAGVITVRQTAYDKDNKGVMLQGIGVTWYAARSSILHETSSFDGKTFEQVAREVIAPTRVGVVKIGTLNSIPFEKLQNEPGETVWNFLERIARPKGVVMGSDEKGNLLLIGDHVGTVSDALVEGVNILRCQAVISIEAIYSDYVLRGQAPGNDVANMKQQAEQEASAPGTARRYSPLLTVAEQPVWSVGELADRAKNESVWHEGTIVQATIVVQGWMRADSGMLWTAGDDVYVQTPMAMLDMVMKIQTVTFSQDRESGTITTLDVVAPWLLKDHSDYNVKNPNAPQPPGTAAPTTAPATTPPAAPVADAPPATLEGPG